MADVIDIKSVCSKMENSLFEVENIFCNDLQSVHYRISLH